MEIIILKKVGVQQLRIGRGSVLAKNRPLASRADLFLNVVSRCGDAFFTPKSAKFHTLQNPPARPPALDPPARRRPAANRPVLVAYLGLFTLVCCIDYIFRLHFGFLCIGFKFRLHIWVRIFDFVVYFMYCIHIFNILPKFIDLGAREI